MASESNVCGGAEGDELKQEEEKKMEEFFSLIRSFRETRNRRRSELKEREREREMEMEMEKERRKRKSDDAESSWVPSFEWEDFREDLEMSKPPLIFRSGPANKKQDKKIEDSVNGGLDLSLTL